MKGARTKVKKETYKTMNAERRVHFVIFRFVNEHVWDNKFEHDQMNKFTF